MLALPLIVETGAVSASPGVANESTTSNVTASTASLPEGGRGRIRHLPFRPQAIRGHYIAVFRDEATVRNPVRALVRQFLRRHPQIVVQRLFYLWVRGFHFRATPALAARIAADRRVAFVQPDFVHHAQVLPVTGAQNRPPSWGLDRIDQRTEPLDSRYVFPGDGSGVNAYIIDSGIRPSHREFGGRAVAAVDFTGEGNQDCAGHGTHVAGTIGGTNVGVAKGVRLVGLKVPGCDNSGSTSNIIAALDWVARYGQRPGVINMSLGHPGDDEALSKATYGAFEAGFNVVVAAGNYAEDACGVSPAQEGQVITVGATNQNDSRDTQYSDYGQCLNIFAPGTNIYSAWPASDSSYETMSGTSMATPHVVGALAVIRGQHPDYSAVQAYQCLTGLATRNVLGSVGSGSPNRLLFIRDRC
ncbi:S8 family peptidase [Luedemannella flava]